MIITKVAAAAIPRDLVEENAFGLYLISCVLVSPLTGLLRRVGALAFFDALDSLGSHFREFVAIAAAIDPARVGRQKDA